ncbi:MAG: methyltransferase domain-containing protein [Gemmatimonadales bacterium]|nr:MAG: methyltransferase domain-containing protein [Gemmatimonadales bacterium]
MTSNRATTPLPAAVLLAAAVLALALLGPDRDVVGLALIPWALAFAALIHLVARHPEWLGRPAVLLGGAVVLRALWLPVLPDLSDDIFRYLWDGWLGIHRISPFLHVPSDPTLAGFQESVLFREMNSPDVHSIYPALSQLVFLGGGLLYEWVGLQAGQLAIMAGFTLLELGGLLLLHRALRRGTTLPPALLALWAWNPLALLVVAGGGHSEGGLVLGLGLLLAAPTLSTPRRRSVGLWAGWALASLSKGIPLVLLPLVWRASAREGGRKQATLGALGAITACGLATLPFLRPADLPGVVASAQLYVLHFEFNAGLYFLLKAGVEALPFAIPGTDPTAGGGPVVGPLLRLVFLVGALALTLRHPVNGVRFLARGLLLVFGLYLVTATTVHPWYLLWVLPLVPFTSLTRAPWLWASAAALPTYLTYTGTSHLLLTGFFWGGWVVALALAERERVFRPLRRLAARRKAGWVGPHVRPGLLLDVGGGDGHLARRIQESSGGQVRAFVADPAPPGRHGGEGPILRVRADGGGLPLATASAPTVLLAFVLHHAEDPDRVLAEAIRVSGGRLIVLESTCRSRLGCRALAELDRWVNAGREASAADLRRPRYRNAQEWLEAIRVAAREQPAPIRVRVVEVDRPNRVGHRVARMVVDLQRTEGGWS